MLSLPGTTRQLSRQECTNGNCHALIINPGLMNNNLHMQLILGVFTEPPSRQTQVYTKDMACCLQPACRDLPA